MKLSTTINGTINALRDINTELKTLSKEKSSIQDKLILALITDGINLYVADKKAFTSYNLFIEAYEAELLTLIDENEKSLSNSIAVTIFALSKGLKTKATMKQIKSIFKYANYITFSLLTDNKAINAEINESRKAYEAELLAINTNLVNTLNSKSSLQLDVIKEVTSIVKRDVIKAEKKALKEAKKA